MHQRDYILRIIEQLGAALVELRKRILGRLVQSDSVEAELQQAARHAGMDIAMLRGFDLDSLHMFAAPGGEIEPTRCWLMAEVLFTDGLAATAEERKHEARMSLLKARALFEMVRPGGGMLLGMPEADERIEDIDRCLAEIGPARERRVSATPRRVPA